MPRNKRRTLKDGTFVKKGMTLSVRHQSIGVGWKGVQVKVLELYDWECHCEIVKTGKHKGASFRVGRMVWLDNKHLLRIEGGALVEHLRSLVRVSRK